MEMKPPPDVKVFNYEWPQKDCLTKKDTDKVYVKLLPI